MDEPATAGQRLEAEVRARFEALARDPASERRFAVGRASALALGYDAAVLDQLPPAASDSFAGVGCPWSLGVAPRGATVLDVGCGAGLDLLLAARAAGPAGRAIGVDFAPAMVAKARANAAAARAARPELAEIVVHEAPLVALPLPDASVDLLLSNGAFNLCVDKPRVVAEWARVVKPGGRLQLADIVLHDDVTPERREALGEWSA
ncbi:MAG: methyltransferase domain-containing protein [Planctomycetes bacterium]|nr:methyltransferase domain-containing protein [Planctomycetota bacterium]